MSFDTGIPNIRVVIREASNENLTVDVPNVSVNIQPGSQYNVNIIPNTVTTLRTGSFNTYADFAGIAATASYISGSGIIAGFATSASYALNAVSASYVSGSTTIGPGTVQSIALFDSTSTISSSIIYQSSNKIGIGTTSPTSSLHVSSNATIVTIEDFNSGQPTSIANVEYKYNSGSLGYVGYSGLATGSLDIWNYYSLGNIRFGTNNIERVRIDSTGRIGIGTISPSASIQVQGNQVISASSAQTSSLDIAHTWSGSGVTYNSIKLNVTDTTSSASSSLMDLQVNGISQFKLQKNGNFTVGRYNVTGFNGIRFDDGNLTFTRPVDGSAVITINTNANVISAGALTSINGVINFASNGDLSLFRDAADALAQRRTTNPQTFRIYNTFTDLSNFERGILQWSSNVLNMGTEHSGSGSPRRLNFIGNGISFASINANPATEVWRFNGSGHFVAGTDNTYDIGTSGALRPRMIYVGSNLIMPTGGGSSVQWENRSRIYGGGGDGVIFLSNTAANDFNRLQFGGTTSTFPSLKRSGSALQVRLADDSGDGGFTAGATTISGIQNNTDTTNSTFWNNGALTVAGGVGIGRDVNISGSVTILGLLTAVSQSTQYVTSSQLIVADNKIIVNVSDLQRFGGLSVIDSGSTSPTTASIYWDSLNHNFIYENLSGSGYNSALFIAGPVNTGPLGNEQGLTVNRVPVASGTDHIDSRPQSSSIRVDFPSRLTHIEAGLVVTGSVSASGTVGIGGDVVIQGVLYSSGSNIDVDPTTEVVATVPSGSYDAAFFDYIIKKATNYRAGTVTAVWDKNGNIEHMDNSTNDLGSTAEVVLTLDSSGGNIRLLATVATNDWVVKSSVRAL